MSRYTFLKQIDTLDDIDIYDLNIPWYKFPFSKGYTLYTITENDIVQTGYLSSQFYDGNSDYDDIIMLINNIEDPFDIPIGLEIKIPDLTELKNWLKDEASKR